MLIPSVLVVATMLFEQIMVINKLSAWSEPPQLSTHELGHLFYKPYMILTPPTACRMMRLFLVFLDDFFNEPRKSSNNVRFEWSMKGHQQERSLL